jgi:hypothetical protein
MTQGEICDLLAQYPGGITATALARQACGPATDDRYGFRVRAMAGYLGVLARRGVVIKRGNMYFPRAPYAAQPSAAGTAAPQMPPPAWYPTPHGPRYWDGAKWL